MLDALCRRIKNDAALREERKNFTIEYAEVGAHRGRWAERYSGLGGLGRGLGRPAWPLLCGEGKELPAKRLAQACIRARESCPLGHAMPARRMCPP